MTTSSRFVRSASLVDRLSIAHVELFECDAFMIVRLGGLPQIGRQDLRAGVSESAGKRAAESSGSAGDQNNFPLDAEIWRHPFLRHVWLAERSGPHGYFRNTTFDLRVRTHISIRCATNVARDR
jgi:hypothetical protein